MTWKIKSFEELTTAELYQILRLRAEVFVVEQNCVYQDVDLKDEKAYHLLCEKDGELAAYLRILQKGVSYPEISIGRVLTKEVYRKQGLAREMLLKAIEYAESILNETEIRISAQAYLIEFYESLGFKTSSDIYLEDGIEHIEMRYMK